MKKILSRNTWLILLITIFSIFILPNNNVYADDNLEVDGFNIMPVLDEKEIKEVNDSISKVWSKWWEVWNNYNNAAAELSTTQQITSGIMNRNTIMNYLVFFIKFISQLWLVIWTVFIIYAWYKYMLSVFTNKGATKQIITNAIIWVLIIIFSYAIMRIFTSLIWLT